MVDYATFRITRTEPEPESASAGTSGDWLRLEQEDEDEAPAGGFLEWIAMEGKRPTIENYLQYYDLYESSCDEDGVLEIGLRVAKSRADLAYSMSASHGTLEGGAASSSSVKTSLTVSQQSSLDLGSRPADGVSATWEGDVYAVDGSTISPPPTISVDGSTLSWGVVCSGVIRVSYSSVYDAWTLTIEARSTEEYEEDDVSSAYQSTVFAAWAGGIESLEISLPDMGGYCGGTSVSTGSGDDGDPDGEQCYKHVILVDPCTGEELNSWDEVMLCPDDDDGDDDGDDGGDDG